MVAESSKELMSAGFGNQIFKDIDESKKWSNSQLWRTIRIIADNKDMQIGPSDLLYSVFDGNKTALKSLVCSKILSLGIYLAFFSVKFRNCEWQTSC